MKATYAHTNLIAKDWRRLADFYERVLGCTPLGPVRDISGPALEEATGMEHARIRGVHLRFPGRGDGGPTLEIFEYSPAGPEVAKTIHRPGFGHIAFRVDDVGEARDEIIAAGGGKVGEVTSLEVAGAGRVTFVYVTDPEGNVVELQSWASDPPSAGTGAG